MKLIAASSLVVLIGLASAHPRWGSSLLKRWEYDVCINDCSLAGVPVPDEDNFQLPLENFFQEQCPEIIVGPSNAPVARSRVCLDFVGSDIVFNFNPFPDYVTKSAVVTWKLKGNVNYPSSWTSPPPTSNILCDSNQVCRLPFASVLNVPSTTSIRDLLAGMCPNGDREGLILYLQLSGLVEPSGGGPAVPFTQGGVCTARDSNRQCTAWDPNYPYFEISYRCTNCNVNPCPPASSSTTTSATTTASPTTTSASPTTTSASPTTTSASPTTTSASPTTTSASPTTTSASPTTTSTTTSSTTSSAPPTLKTCAFGTAFGYQNPVAGQQKSFTLNTQSGNGCNRWGWYETPTVAELQGGISGPLYVGAGGNDITKAIDVGIWVATANAQGRVTVTYLLNPPYTLAEVHVDLKCLPISTCAPGQYTYNAGAIPNLPTWSNPTPLVYPTCSGGSKAYLIVHAAVNYLTVVSSCPPPKAA